MEDTKVGTPARTYKDSGRDYSGRSGFPQSPDQMRGKASSRRHLMDSQNRATDLRARQAAE